MSSTSIDVAVRRASEVRLDARGHVVAARTNSGCAPRSDDSVAVEVDGRPEPAPAAIVAKLGGIIWLGDWRVAGVWHAVACCPDAAARP